MGGVSRIYQGVLLRQMDAVCELLHAYFDGMHPRKPLTASMSIVLLYLSHLSQEGEVCRLQHVFNATSPLLFRPCDRAGLRRSDVSRGGTP
jgi:hypothetical protein